MAVVRTIKCSNGATVHICDDGYVGVPLEEMRRRQKEVLDTAKRIFINAEIRRIQQEHEAAEQSDEE